jgi:hypothetical protein
MAIFNSYVSLPEGNILSDSTIAVVGGICIFCQTQKYRIVVDRPLYIKTQSTTCIPHDFPRYIAIIVGLYIHCSIVHWLNG